LAAPSFEGKWQGETTHPGGDKVVRTCELKADGKAEVSIIDKDGKVLRSQSGTWKKTGDKTIELAIDKELNPGKGELLDDKTMELTDPGGKKKFKLTRQ
jgi:hypothetical protein